MLGKGQGRWAQGGPSEHDVRSGEGLVGGGECTRWGLGRSGGEEVRGQLPGPPTSSPSQGCGSFTAGT